MALPCLVAVWMISGFYLSLGPSLAAQVLRSPDLLWGGLVIFLLNGTGTSATVAARRAGGPTAMLAGCLALLTGTAVTLAAIQGASGAAFLAGTAVAGAGFGTAMLGVFRAISALAAPGQRAGLIAAYFIASYTAFSVPVVAAGIAITHVGLHRTALAYCTVIVILAAIAAASLIFRRRSTPHADPSPPVEDAPLGLRGPPHRPSGAGLLAQLSRPACHRRGRRRPGAGQPRHGPGEVQRFRT
jgi:MFS family permease